MCWGRVRTTCLKLFELNWLEQSIPMWGVMIVSIDFSNLHTVSVMTCEQFPTGQMSVELRGKDLNSSLLKSFGALANTMSGYWK